MVILSPPSGRGKKKNAIREKMLTKFSKFDTAFAGLYDGIYGDVFSKVWSKSNELKYICISYKSVYLPVFYSICFG